MFAPHRSVSHFFLYRLNCKQHSEGLSTHEKKAGLQTPSPGPLGDYAIPSQSAISHPSNTLFCTHNPSDQSNYDLYHSESEPQIHATSLAWLCAFLLAHVLDRL
jgi:hypothetical protein